MRFRILSKLLNEVVPVLVVQKDWTAVISTRGHMIYCTSKLYS